MVVNKSRMVIIGAEFINSLVPKRKLKFMLYIERQNRIGEIPSRFKEFIMLELYIALILYNKYMNVTEDKKKR